jgi:transposase, IS5 family
MFKCLVLQQLYNLSDEEFEFQLRDRLTFIRFVGLNPEDTTPDANTLWDFRELLTRKNQLSNLFNHYQWGQTPLILNLTDFLSPPRALGSALKRNNTT